MDTLRVYLVTWNVATKPPEQCSLDSLLALAVPDSELPDIYIIGLQEVKSQIHNVVLDALFDDPWTIAFKSKLRGKNYVKLRTVRLQGLVLNVFCQRRHLLHMRDMESQYVKTGLGRLWGNKGCVAVRLSAYGTSLCLLNSHLTPHDHNLQSRVDDYNHIIKSMSFTSQKDTAMIFYHDYVFWIGDQNFRFDEAISNEEILNRIKNKKMESLRSADQLSLMMRTGRAFSELDEEPVNFDPTYKFLFNTSEYDPKRRPAWTDRILYKVNSHAYENVTLSADMKLYHSVPEQSLSDHKPVVGQFHVKVFRDHVDRLVELHFGTRGTRETRDVTSRDTWIINEENEVWLTPGDDVVLSDWDWIGVYKADFSALDEYVSFVYVSPARPREGDDEQVVDLMDSRRERRQSSTSHNSTGSSGSSRRKVKFPDNMMRTPGDYCLLYLNSDSGSVLGSSHVFHADFKQGTMLTSSTSPLPPRHSPRRSPVRVQE